MLTSAFDLDNDDDYPIAPTRQRTLTRINWRPKALLATAHIWLPLLLLAILAIPSVDFLLPATQDQLDEIYQPLQALKFFQTHGHAFHKYGPMPNFILAPGYAASLAWWKVTGSLQKVSSDYPYGFTRPFQQMGWLIFQGRAIFLLLALFAFGYLAHTLRTVASNTRFATAMAILFCIATNWATIHEIPTPRPDSPMLAFTALALACYLGIIHRGLTLRRAVWFSLFAVFATTSKELAGPMFVFPFLAMTWIAWKRTDDRRQALRIIGWSLVTGIVAYALLNIVYAPHTWLQRMHFWLLGPGINADVWGRSASITARISKLLQCLLDNFGPGGSIVVVAALVAALVRGRRGTALILLPAISVSLLALARIQYPSDRFYTILALALTPVIAEGIDVLLALAPKQVLQLRGTLIVCAIANAYFATFAAIALSGSPDYLIEQHAQSKVDRNAESLCVLNLYPSAPGSTRLEQAGFRYDGRSIQQIAAAHRAAPDWIYVSNGKLDFIDDAKSLPARAKMLRDDSGFDVSKWSGIADLGYHLDEKITPQAPGWFPFTWMPALREWQARRSLQIWRKNTPALATARGQ